MNNIFFSFAVILFLATVINAQQKPKYPLPEDVATIDGIMNATYEVVSSQAGVAKQWERDQSLHDPNAVYAFLKTDDGKPRWVTMSLKKFHALTDEIYAKSDFFESEANREVRIFGNIAHVWSTYESRLKKNGPVVKRGINSVQLYYSQNRWWIISWTFERETDQNRIPKSFDRN